MPHHQVLSALGWCIALALVTSPLQAEPPVEVLDRGLVALNQGSSGVFLSWRLLQTDAPNIGFNVYRQASGAAPERLNEQPLRAATVFTDMGADFTQPQAYFVRPVVSHSEGESSKPFRFGIAPPTRDYLAIPLVLPQGYHANDASVGDVDGDGQYEIILHAANVGRDNSQGGLTQPAILQAYRLDGSLLWTINLGKNIREGAHYTQFMVFDFDSNGKAELICKTADGTVDGIGKVIGDPAADYRIMPPAESNGAQLAPSDSASNRATRGRNVPNDIGKILSGPEYLSVFEGLTGAAIASVPYVPSRGESTDNPSRAEQQAMWGDNYGNRIDRFLATVAYLDGVHPSVVMCRGYYTRTVVAAWDFRNGNLVQRWVFDSDAVERKERENRWRGQGNHSIATADVDGDGRDEIIYGAMVIDDDGQGLYSTQLGHGDAQHTSDLDPSRPGLEIWSIHENEKATPEFIGAEMRDARTGEIIFVGARGRDVGRGLAADIDPRHLGYEMWGGSNNLFNCQGTVIGRCPRSQNMAIWWDGDLLRELLDGVSISKWDYENEREITLFDGRQQGLVSNNGSKSNPCLCADILGDWREEMIARNADSSELRIYVSTVPTQHRLKTLMHNRQYRVGVAWQNVGYNQPPHPSFFLGEGMKPVD